MRLAHSLLALSALGMAVLACSESSRPTRAASGGEAGNDDNAGAGFSASGATEGHETNFLVIDPVQNHALRTDEDPTAFDRSTTVSHFSADASTFVGFSQFQPLGDAPLYGGREALRWTEGSGVVGLGFAPGLDMTEPRALQSAPYCVSLDGSTVAGTSWDSSSSEVFLWTEAAGMMNLDKIAGTTGIELNAASSDCMVLVGTARDDQSHLEAVRWSEASGWQRTGRLPGDSDSQALYVSADGATVVAISQTGATRHGYRWTEDAGIASLGQLPGTQYCYPRGATADARVIVGDCFTETGAQAFRWTEATGMVSLGSVPGSKDSLIARVSADGEVVVGTYYDANSNAQVFRWTEATGMIELGLLAGYTKTTSVRMMNADGTVLLGDATNGNKGVHFRWTEATGLVALEPLPGDDTAFAASLSLDGSVVAGLSGQPNSMGVGWSVANAVVWDDTGTAHSVAANLTGAGVDLNDFHLDLAYVAPVTGQTVLYGLGKSADGVRAWVAWLP